MSERSYPMRDICFDFGSCHAGKAKLREGDGVPAKDRAKSGKKVLRASRGSARACPMSCPVVLP